MPRYRVELVPAAEAEAQETYQYLLEREPREQRSPQGSSLQQALACSRDYSMEARDWTDDRMGKVRDRRERDRQILDELPSP